MNQASEHQMTEYDGQSEDMNIIDKRLRELLLEIEEQLDIERPIYAEKIRSLVRSAYFHGVDAGIGISKKIISK